MSNSNEALKKCCRCENIQLIENFNKDKNRKDGLYPLCIDCREKFYLKNLDKIKKCNEKKTKKKETYISKTNEKQMLNFV